MNTWLEQFDQIADGLAGVGYSIIDDFLGVAAVQAIRDLKEFQQGIVRFRKAGVGGQHQRMINESIRSDQIEWIDPLTAPAAIGIYLDRIRELIPFVNRNLFLSLKDFEFHMTVYPAGAFYLRHLDQFKGNGHRKLSVILYLNPEWKAEHGGHLRMYLKEGYKDLLPLGGRLVCFRSDLIEHEVLPSTRERYSITGWILDEWIARPLG